MLKRITILIASITLSLWSVSVSPHHAFSAEFDIDRPISLEGTLAKWEMINPHSWFHIDVDGPDGEVVRWRVEGGTPNTLIRNGVTINSVPIGTLLIVEGYQAKDRTNKAVGRSFVLSDGSRLFLGGSAAKVGASGQ
jgi:hypothetical protein